MTDTPIAVFAQRQIDVIEESFTTAPLAARGVTDAHARAGMVFSRLTSIRREEEVQRGLGLAQRIADGECAVLGNTCLTHNEEMTPGHLKSIDPSYDLD